MGCGSGFFGQCRNRIHRLADQFRALIDKTGVQLHQAGARGDLLGRMLTFGNTAYRDNRQTTGQLGSQHLDDMGALVPYRRARQATGFIAMGQVLRRRPGSG